MRTSCAPNEDREVLEENSQHKNNKYTNKYIYLNISYLEMTYRMKGKSVRGGNEVNVKIAHLGQTAGILSESGCSYAFVM